MSGPPLSGAIRNIQALWEDEPLRKLLRATILFLQKVFESAPDSGYRWAENDPSASKITITADIPIPTDAIGARPHIAVSFAGVQWAGIGMDQLKSASFLEGWREHQDMINGTLMISVLSRNAEEATYIAWNTAKFVWLLRRVLMIMGFHDIGQGVNISAPSTPGSLIQGDGGEEISVVHISCPFSFAWAARIETTGGTTVESFEITLAAEVSGLSNDMTRNRLPVGMIGSASMTESGGRLYKEFDPLASLGTRAERKAWRAVSLDDPPAPPAEEQLEMNIIVREE